MYKPHPNTNMSMRSNSMEKPGIRSLITGLLMIAALPGLAMVTYGYMGVRDDAVARAREEVRAAAEMAAATEEQMVEGVRQTLATVASGPSVRRNDLLDLCNEYVTNISRTFPNYGSISVFNLQGRPRCLSDASTKAITVSERSAFERAVASRQFAMDDYSMEASTDGDEIGFALPVFDYAETVTGVAYATLNLSHVSARLDSLSVSESVTVMITDGKGTVLATNKRDVQDIGTSISNPALLQRIARSAPEGRVIPADTEEDWLHEVVRVGEMNSEPIYAIASAKRSDILAEPLERLQLQLIILALSCAVGIVLAMRLAERQFISPISALLKRMEAAAQQKTAPPSTGHVANAPSREFAALEKTFTSMLQELNKKDAQLNKAQEITRVGFFQLDLEKQVYTGSASLRDIFGLEKAFLESSTEKSLTPAQYLSMIHPEDRERVRQHRTMVLEGKKPEHIQYRIIRPDGETRWIDAFGFVEHDSQGKPILYAGALQDVSEQHRLRRLYQVQSKINEAILSARSVQDLFERVCSICVAHAEMRMACVAAVDPQKGTVTVVASAGHDEGYTDILSTELLDVATLDLPIPTALRTAKLAVSNNLATALQKHRWAVEAARRRYRSVAAVPFKTAGQATKALVLMASETEYFQAAECRQLEAIGESLAAAVNHLNEEARRRDREERLKLLETCIARLNDIVLITEAEPFGEPGPRILFVNDAFERLTGYAKEEVIGKTPRILQGPKTDRQVLDRIRHHLERWEPVREEIINYTKDGREIWLELDIVPVADETGWYTHWVAIERDITQRIELKQQRERALIELKTAQDRLLRAQTLSRTGHWERFANDGPAVWSASLFEITGNDPEKGVPSLEACMSKVHPEDFETYLAIMNDGFTQGKMRRWTYRCVFPDGRVSWLEETIDEPKRDESGAVVSISGTVQDVTERLEGEQNLKMQLARTVLLNKIARATDERLNLGRIFEVVCENLEAEFAVGMSAALIYDSDADAFEVVRMGTRGAPQCQSCGLSEGILLAVGSDALDRSHVGEFVYEPDTRGMPCDFPKKLAQAGLGSVVFAPMRAQGRVFGVLVAARSLPNAFNSEECNFLMQLAEHVALAASHARLYQDLQLAYEELQGAQQVSLQQERLRVLGQMASGIAHDINNAITPMALYTESLLNKEKGLSERGRKQLSTIQLAVDDVAETVARMREFYRPADGFTQRSSVDLNRLVTQVVELTRARWRDIPQQTGVSIDMALNLSPSLPQVSLVEAEIRDALTNLVLNAVDAMPEGGDLIVATSQKVDESGQPCVVLEISDTGVGMDEQTRLRCMEPFFTTKGERGSGLGLSMVYGALQRHEAEISLMSEPGKGTTFGIRFLAQASSATGGGDQAAEATSGKRRSLKILLIDDEVALLSALSEMLEGEGHLVTSAGGGQEGLDLFKASLKAGGYDVVITDLGMPRVDGNAVATGVKAMSPKTPVIMLTGWGRRMLEDGVLPPCVDHLLGKPARMALLREALVSCMSG
ncbi:PAS domain-containing protein [Hydrogenophaga sp.]|uniref:PAS domain-containing protein n=1 Tax=Hydrogenophaga sp. TaxID=1904254 RepID=UPI0025C431D6|nr:PAS domain-containing protein [Hydrogenophaga sp.]MBT9463547.1 PAS domain-containing protein [Hydrogenophaga sp.]